MTSLLNIAGNIPVSAAAVGGQSLRFEDGDSAYLSRTPTTAGNRKKFTISVWVKRAKLSSGQDVIMQVGTETGGNERSWFYFTNSDTLTFMFGNSATNSVGYEYYTNAKFRDPSAWYHVVAVIDTDNTNEYNSTAGTNRIEIYVNGEFQTLVRYRSAVPSGYANGRINQNIEHRIGAGVPYGGYSDCYLANYTFLDGQALDPTSFGEYSDTLWKPKSDADIQSLTFGTNGFYLPFAGDIAAGSSYYFDGSSDYVSYSSASLYDVGSSDDFELECFFNTDMVSGSGDYGYMLGNYDGSSQFMTLQPDFRSANESFAWYIGNGQAWVWDYTSGDVSPNTWHHLTISRTSGTLRMFLDGARLTSITSASASNGSISGGNVINNTSSYNLSSFRIGQAYAGQKAYKGYVSNVRFIVGSSIRNSDSNFTVPTSTLTDVTNTKLLTATNLTIGDDISSNNNDGSASGDARSSGVNPFGEYDFFEDVSGNGNNWLPNNLQYTDSVPDSPTNSFCTLNPLTQGSYTTLKDGNLTVNSVYSADLSGAASTWYPTTGKWYWEIHAEASTLTYPYFGITDQSNTNFGSRGTYHAAAWNSNGGTSAPTSYLGTVTINSVTSRTNDDIIMFALDVDNRKLWIGKNGTWESSGDPAAGTNENASWTNDTAVSPCFMGYNGQGVGSVFNFGQDGTFAGNLTGSNIGTETDDNDVGAFKYTPPSGFLAMASSNLDTPAITAPDDYFNTVLYTGNDTTRDITVGFQPDWVWIKARSTTSNHPVFDNVRGALKELYTNLTNSESTETNGLSQFNSDGFRLLNTRWNGTGTTYVAWNWLAGNSTSSNTDGSLTSTVSANQTAGFSVGTVTTASQADTIGHGLSQSPDMVIFKPRNGALSWGVYHSSFSSANNYLFLESTNGTGSSSAYWNSTAPTSTVFSIGSTWGTYDAVFYAFHSVDGYSKCGKYVGNSSSDGVYVALGFRPAWVMIKSTSSSTQWMIYDNKREGYNVDNDALTADDSSVEKTDDDIDFLGNGFKLRRSSPNFNYSGYTYIFYAVAEAPFKSANAR